MFSKAMSEDDGSVDGADGVEGGNFACVAAKAVTAVGALFGAEEAGLVEFLEDLGQERERDVVALRNFLGTGDTVAGVDGEVLEGD